MAGGEHEAVPVLPEGVGGVVAEDLSVEEGPELGGAEGVGKATTRSVVMICMSILFFDYVLTSLLTTSL